MLRRRAATHLGARRPSPRVLPSSPASPSSVALGTAYERATGLFLAQSPRFRLKGVVRVGGAGDQGIDLRANWDAAHLTSPSSSPRTRANAQTPPSPTTSTSAPLSVPVIIQCKAESSRVGPSTVRELEGTLLAQQRRGAPSHLSRRVSHATPTPHVGVLVALNGFSDAAIRHARSSRLPLELVHLAVPDVGSMVQSGGDQAGVEMVSTTRNDALEGLGREVLLAWRQGAKDADEKGD